MHNYFHYTVVGLPDGRELHCDGIQVQDTEIQDWQQLRKFQLQFLDDVERQTGIPAQNMKISTKALTKVFSTPRYHYCAEISVRATAINSAYTRKVDGIAAAPRTPELLSQYEELKDCILGLVAAECGCEVSDITAYTLLSLNRID